MRKSKRVSRQRRPKPFVPVQPEESINPEPPTESVVAPVNSPELPTVDLFTLTNRNESEMPVSEVDEVVNVPMATPYIPWYVPGRSKPGELVRVKDDQGQVQVVIIPEGGLHG